MPSTNDDDKYEVQLNVSRRIFSKFIILNWTPLSVLQFKLSSLAETRSWILNTFQFAIKRLKTHLLICRSIAHRIAFNKLQHENSSLFYRHFPQSWHHWPLSGTSQSYNGNFCSTADSKLDTVPYWPTIVLIISNICRLRDCRHILLHDLTKISLLMVLNIESYIRVL